MIRPQLFPSGPSYQAVIRALLRMHRFTLEGKDESEEAELFRESMSGFWESLSKVERERVNGLSIDLYEISDHPGRAPEPMNPQAQRRLGEVSKAVEWEEWDRALGLLRRWGKYVPASRIAYLRGTIWRSAGDAATAVVFFEHACQLDAGNEFFQAALLDALETADPKEAAARAEVILQNSETRNPIVVLTAAGAVFTPAREMPALDASTTYRRLIPILEQTLARVEGDADLDYPAPRGMALVLLATCCREIGETQEAYGYYSRAIQLDPNNSELLIARGMLMYGTDPSPAADFERAIRLGSRLVAPYFYLARHYLANNLFEKCRSMCERGLQCFASARAQSELWELLAISLTTLGCPERDIRLAFENSIRVDPSNVRARRNLEIFQAAVPPLAPQPENWEGGSESSLRAPAQEEKVWPEAAPLERRAMAML